MNKKILTEKLCMCTGGENSLILIKLYIYVQVFYMVRLPSKKKKKKNPDLSTHFFFWHVTGNILIFFGLIRNLISVNLTQTR